MIKDSGNRTEFEVNGIKTGAVRDMREGKGRCDLMPLDVVAESMRDNIIWHIYDFQVTGAIKHLYFALADLANMPAFNGQPTMFLETAKHFEEGAKKYGEHNWQLGIPVKCYIDSAVRHYLKWRRGDNDESHDRAFCWNIMTALWTCKHKPELNEYGKDDCNDQ